MSVNNKLIDIEKLSRYHENLKEVLNTKEAAGEAAKAEAAAKKYADEEIAKLSFDEAGAAGEAYEAAKDYADDLVKNEDGSVKFDDKGAAATAEQNAKDYADSLAGNYDASGSAATAEQNAKDYADGLASNYDASGSAATAEQNAKDYADGLAGNYDAAGAAATAEQNAKDYADGLAGNYDAAGTAAGLNAAMNERVEKLEAIDHNKIVADAIAAVVDEADSDFDTLREVADWINNDKTGAAALQVAVSEHGEAIEGLTNDKQDNITDLETIRTGAAAGAVAEQNAKDYADSLAGNYDAAGSASTAEQNAKDYADGLAGNYDAAGSAAGAQSAAEATAKTYTDAEIVKVNTTIEENEKVTAESLTDLDTRVKDLKDTTYNKTEIDTMVGNVIVVASDEEIDNLFK